MNNIYKGILGSMVFIVIVAAIIFANPEFLKGAFPNLNIQALQKYSKDPKNTNLLVILTDKIVATSPGALIGDFKDIRDEEVRKVFFGDKNSVKSYYRDNSYGKINLEGEIKRAIGFDGRPLQDLVDALDPSVDFSRYQYFYFITLRSGDCTGGGSQGRTDQFNTREGMITVGSGASTVRCLTQSVEIIHELGHALGLKHTGSWLENPAMGCSENIPLENLPNNECYSTYGATPMGTGDGDLFIFQRNKLAAPLVAPFLTISENGDYWIHWHRNNRSGKYYDELRIPAINGYYSVEFRHDIIAEIEKGVMINFIPNDAQGFFGPLSSGGIEILLVHAPAFSLHNVQPLPDSSFYDALRNISVQVLKIEEGRALLRIRIK